MKHRFATHALRAGLALVFFGAAPAAWAQCRVTDFSDRPLSSLSEPQLLAFASQMLNSEYTRLHAVPAGDLNHYPLLANATGYVEARASARAGYEALGLENTEELRRQQASEWLDDAGLARFANCVSARQPGLLALGRRQDTNTFHLTFAHITPIGIEKITTRLIASSNIANVAEFERFLAEIGPQDNYTAKLFPLKLIDPAKRAVVVLRAGWETPRFVIIQPQ